MRRVAEQADTVCHKSPTKKKKAEAAAAAQEVVERNTRRRRSVCCGGGLVPVRHISSSGILSNHFW